MKSQVALVAVALAFVLSTSSVSSRYQPTWDSIDSRPIPQWYDDAKLGVFIHYGVFSVPSFSTEWFWEHWVHNWTSIVKFMKDNYPPSFTYQDFAKDLKAEFFDAKTWAELIQDSGAKYLVFVSKHHEGYTNWPSKYSYSWNSMDVGPKRDIVGELAEATRKYTNVTFGLYHSLFEWFHPLFEEDAKNKFKTQNFVNAKTMPELYEIVNTYKPEVVWSDGDWSATPEYWKSKEFLAWLYNDSPVKDTVVTNDRWGQGAWCKHGGVISCGDRSDPGHLIKRKWVNAMTLDKWSWGFRREAPLSDFYTIEELLQLFVRTVSCNGNLLMNVGPPSHGHISAIYEERFRQMGAWLKVNGEGIYKSRPWTYQNDTAAKDVWYTMQNNNNQKDVYAFVYKWPTGSTMTLTKPKVSSSSKVSLVGYSGTFAYQTRPQGGIDIKVPAIPFNKMPCQWLWAIKITDVQN